MVEGNSLENCQAGNGLEGSNPSLSAMDSTSSPLGGLFEFIMGGVRTRRVRAVRRAGK